MMVLILAFERVNVRSNDDRIFRTSKVYNTSGKKSLDVVVAKCIFTMLFSSDLEQTVLKVFTLIVILPKPQKFLSINSSSPAAGITSLEKKFLKLPKYKMPVSDLVVAPLPSRS